MQVLPRETPMREKLLRMLLPVATRVCILGHVIGALVAGLECIT